jgi:hypothetical protein
VQNVAAHGGSGDDENADATATGGGGGGTQVWGLDARPDKRGFASVGADKQVRTRTLCILINTHNINAPSS